VRKNAGVHRRLLAAWQLIQSRSDEERAALEIALQPWDEARDPVPFAALDTILSKRADERKAWLKEFNAVAGSAADNDAWSAFRIKLGRA
jgi:hypothetical protein